MKFFSAIAAFAVVAITQAQVYKPPTYPLSESCASYPTQQNVTSFTMTPGDYCIGRPYTVTTTGPLHADVIEGATVTLFGRWLGRLVYTDNQDLCKLLAAAGTPCPIAKTATSLSFDLLAKKNIPPNVVFTYQFQVVNGDGGTIFCRATAIAGKNCA
ncbi:hypothetical protein BGZ81_002120 [Podila clonocystis]|nr:hypothetical protein BGZ81_002120 [Podila clonocystis]